MTGPCLDVAVDAKKSNVMNNYLFWIGIGIGSLLALSLALLVGVIFGIKCHEFIVKNVLFDDIKCGDEKHQRWLKHAIDCWVDGKPIPRGEKWHCDL